MKSSSYYRTQADEVAQFARVSRGTQRPALLAIAQAWYELAEAAARRETAGPQRLVQAN